MTATLPEAWHSLRQWPKDWCFHQAQPPPKKLCCQCALRQRTLRQRLCGVGHARQGCAQLARTGTYVSHLTLMSAGSSAELAPACVHHVDVMQLKLGSHSNRIWRFIARRQCAVSHRGHDAINVLCSTRPSVRLLAIVTASDRLRWRRPATAITAASRCQRCAATGQPRAGHLSTWCCPRYDTSLNMLKDYRPAVECVDGTRSALEGRLHTTRLIRNGCLT